MWVAQFSTPCLIAEGMDMMLLIEWSRSEQGFIESFIRCSHLAAASASFFADHAEKPFLPM